MRYGELKDYVAETFLHNSNLNNETYLAIRSAHLKIQRAHVNAAGKQITTGNWNRLRTFSDLSYTTSDNIGIFFPAFSKQEISVSILGDDGTITPIYPASAQEIDALLLQWESQVGSQPTSESQESQRWYINHISRFQLLYPINATLRVYHYSPLSLPSDDTALSAYRDYFSVDLWDVMAYGAAWLASLSLWEDTRAATFRALYETELASAWRDDQNRIQGGNRRVRRPELQKVGK